MENNITIQDVQNYIEGNANYLLDKIGLLPEEVKAKVDARLKVCSLCSFLEKNEDGTMKKCGKCGCKLPMVAFSLQKTCSVGGDAWKEIKK